MYTLCSHYSHLPFSPSQKAKNHLPYKSLFSTHIFVLFLWLVDFNQGHLCAHGFDTIHWSMGEEGEAHTSNYTAEYSDSLSQNLSAGRGNASWVPLPVVTVDRDYFMQVQLKIGTAAVQSLFPWMDMPDGISQPFSLSPCSSLFFVVVNVITKCLWKKKWVYFIVYF